MARIKGRLGKSDFCGIAEFILWSFDIAKTQIIWSVASNYLNPIFPLSFVSENCGMNLLLTRNQRGMQGTVNNFKFKKQSQII